MNKFNLTQFVVMLTLFIGLILLPHYLRYQHQDFMIFLIINVLVVVSYRLMTLTGEWSLIHIVMMGVGAYTSALMSKHMGVSVWLTIPLAGLSAAVLAGLLSTPLFRMTQFYFLIGSFAVGEAIRLAWIFFIKPLWFFSWWSFTNIDFEKIICFFLNPSFRNHPKFTIH